MQYVDPTGHWVDSVLDIAFIAIDVAQIVANPTNTYNWGALSADVAGLAIPGATGLGRGVKAFEKATDIAKALNKLGAVARRDAIWGKTIMSYKTLKGIAKGTGLEVHHLLEKRLADIFGLKADDIFSVALSKAQHQIYTNDWRKLIPYGTNYSKLSKSFVIDCAKQVYKDAPELLSALLKQLK